MDLKTIILIVGVGVGVLLLASPFLYPLFAKAGAWFKRSPAVPLPVPASEVNAESAFRAVKTLEVYFAGNEAGLKAARECGKALFGEPTK